MRTTVNIDDQLLAEAKLIAARTHLTLGSVLEDALRNLIAEQTGASGEAFELPRLDFSRTGLQPGVDLRDKEVMADLLGENDAPSRRRRLPARDRAVRLPGVLARPGLDGPRPRGT
jgi:hypothetical protein